MKRISQAFHSFMEGRYGSDKLNLFLTVVSAILCVLSLIPYMHWLLAVALIVYAWSVFRTLSRNIYSRQRENIRYLQIKASVTQWFHLQQCKWRDRKTHKYYHCPHCKATVRVVNPHKRKKISIHCPKCHNEFIKKT